MTGAYFSMRQSYNIAIGHCVWLVWPFRIIGACIYASIRITFSLRKLNLKNQSPVSSKTENTAGPRDVEKRSTALLANRLGALSAALFDLIRESQPENLKGDGPELAAMNTIMQWPAVRIDELASVLNFSHSGTVRLLDRLGKQGLVKRDKNTEDARAISLFLTNEGQALVDAFQQRRLAILTKVINTLPLEAHGSLTRTIEDLLKILSYNEKAANRICRFCEERICTMDICPTEEWLRQKTDLARTFGVKGRDNRAGRRSS